MKITQEIHKLQIAARRASAKAKREARALGLTVRVIERGHIYDKTANGEKILIATVSSPKIIARKGTVLRLKK